MYIKKPLLGTLTLLLAFLVLATAYGGTRAEVETAVSSATPRVNMPYTSSSEDDTGGIPGTERAIFWFGQVGPTEANYTDGRAIYNDEKVHITVHVFDKRLYFGNDPTAAELVDWDAVTLYLHTEGPTGSSPSSSSYQFVAQPLISNNQNPEDLKAVYQGDGAGWQTAVIPFEVVAAYRGGGLNDNNDDKGWNLTFRIPYSSLGLSGPPAAGTVWGMALAIHDRDAAGADNIPDSLWPAGMSGNQPQSWAELHFGLPSYSPPPATAAGSTSIRHGVNGANAPDAMVGGGVNCAAQLWPDFWSGWGDLNYNGDSNTNIQNQWDLGDFACFSKYYITFPLDSLPAGKEILSSSLTLYHFGNSLPDEARESLIQVLTIAEPWDEATITWNNAPLPVENISRTLVEPLPLGPPYPNVPYDWDVSQAVAAAYAAGEPLRLVMYAADSPRHSGKYFRPAEVQEDLRPLLQVEWGDAVDFTVTPDSPVKLAAPGDTLTFTLDVQPVGGFADTVTAAATDNYADLTLSVNPTALTPAGQVAVEVMHTNPAQTAGALYTIPVTFSGGGTVTRLDLVLLINGRQLFLPAVTR